MIGFIDLLNINYSLFATLKKTSSRFVFSSHFHESKTLRYMYRVAFPLKKNSQTS